MDWLVGVAGTVLDWVFAVAGTILNWLFGRGIQEPMSVLQGVGAIATAIAVWGAYLQYRDKRYGLSDGEWDILKALQQYRMAGWHLSDGEAVYRFGRSSDDIDVYLDAGEFLDHSNEYPRSCGKVDVVVGDLVLRADRMGISGLPRNFSRIIAKRILASPRYRKYCRSLENRGYLSTISKEENIERYDLTEDGERFMQKQWKNIEKRYFLGEFVDEVDIIDADVRSWHELAYHAVVPEFYHGGRFQGVEFPPSLIYGSDIYEKDNPCGIRYLIRVTKDAVDVERVKNMVGKDVHLKVESPTVHLLGEYLDDGGGIVANMKYFRVEGVWIEMWFVDQVKYTLEIHGIEPSEKEVRRKLEAQQKKIEEVYYRNGHLELPQPYRKRRDVERRGYERKREIWISRRYETRVSRYRRRVSETPGRLWRRLKRLVNRDKAD